MKSDHPNVFLCPNLPDHTNTWSPHLTEMVKSLRWANLFGKHIKLKYMYLSYFFRSFKMKILEGKHKKVTKKREGHKKYSKNQKKKSKKKTCKRKNRRKKTNKRKKKQKCRRSKKNS